MDSREACRTRRNRFRGDHRLSSLLTTPWGKPGDRPGDRPGPRGHPPRGAKDAPWDTQVSPARRRVRAGFIIRPMAKNSFGAAANLRVGSAEYHYFRLAELVRRGVGNVGQLPFSIRILLENLLRNEDGKRVSPQDVAAVAGGAGAGVKEISFMPARVLLQDFTGVPCVVDLAAMRDALGAIRGDPSRANPLLPADLVIDHSVQVDY